MIALILLIFLAFPVEAGQPSPGTRGPQTRAEVIPPGVKAVGTYPFPERSVPDAATEIGLVLDRSGMNAGSIGAVLTYSVEVSMDQGATWQPMFEGLTISGVFVRNGQQAQESNAFRPLPAGTGRLARGVFTVSGRSVTSKLEIAYVE